MNDIFIEHLKALGPLITVGATLYVATSVFKLQKRFERAGDLEKEMRKIYADYLSSIIRRGRERKKIKTLDELRASEDAFAADEAGRLYQSIMLFSPSLRIINATIKLANLDGLRFAEAWKAVEEGEKTGDFNLKSNGNIDHQFRAALPEFYDAVQEDTMRRIGGGSASFKDRIRKALS